MFSTLRIALHDARVARETDRLVRLVVQNLPRFRDVPSLRMELVPTLLEHGDVDDAIMVIQRSAELEIAAGRVAAAVARFRDAEALEVDTHDWWDALFDEMDRRGPAGNPGSQPNADALTEPDRPPLRGDALMGVALELATRVPDDPLHADRFTTLAGMEGLASPARRDVLSALERVPFCAGDRLDKANLGEFVWWVDGVVKSHACVVAPRCGALVDAADTPLVARTDGAVLVIAEHRRDEVVERYQLDHRIHELRRTWSARAAVTASDVWTSLGLDARARLRAALVGHTFDSAVLVEAGERWPMLGVVVDGELEILDRAGEITVRLGKIARGDWFGEALVAADGFARWLVRAKRDVRIVGIPAEHVDSVFAGQDDARSRLMTLFVGRADAVRVLDTGEVELVDDD